MEPSTYCVYCYLDAFINGHQYPPKTIVFRTSDDNLESLRQDLEAEGWERAKGTSVEHWFKHYSNSHDCLDLEISVIQEGLNDLTFADINQAFNQMIHH